MVVARGDNMERDITYGKGWSTGQGWSTWKTAQVVVNTTGMERGDQHGNE